MDLSASVSRVLGFLCILKLKGKLLRSQSPLAIRSAGSQATIPSFSHSIGDIIWINLLPLLDKRFLARDKVRKSSGNHTDSSVVICSVIWSFLIIKKG